MKNEKIKMTNKLMADSNGELYLVFDEGDDSISLGNLMQKMESGLDTNMNKKMDKNTEKLYEINKFSKFGGAFLQHCPGSLRNVHITKVLYNNPATVVWWSDGTLTRNICPDDALYNPDSGLAFCWLKKMFDGDDIARLFHDWAMPDDKDGKNVIVSLKDVRKKHK